MIQNKHTAYDLKQMQSLPLDAKIGMTKRRICEWYDHYDGGVYVSFSGGKDSTVLKHLVDSLYSDVPAVFVNTGLEYPEIQRFVKDIQSGRITDGFGNRFNSYIEILRPEMRFDEVIKTYGYPVGSKEVSKKIYYAKRGAAWAQKFIDGSAEDPNGNPSRYRVSDRFLKLLDAPFEVSSKCCDVMKKAPIHKYEKATKRKAIIGMMAEEAGIRKLAWMRTGCNAFDSKKPKSTPMAFWTEQDVLEYLVKYKVPYASVYGQIQEVGQIDGQMYLDGFHDRLCTTGAKRTGCMFCMFGCHLEKEPNRFQRMKETHPKQYEYCMKPVEKGGLGIEEVLKYIDVPYE